MSSPKTKRRTGRSPGSANRRPSSPTQGKPAPPGGRRLNARARLAIEREQRERRRRLMWMVALPLVVVLVAVGVLVAVRLTRSGTSEAGPSPSTGTGPTSAVVAAATSVPASVLDTVGMGSKPTPPTRANGPALTQDGMPRVLYVGAEYCPYCAAERWSVVVALSRFGTFSGLGLTTSTAQDVFPSTPTLTFHGARYTSKTLAFTGAELQGNTLVNGNYPTLDTLSAADQKIVSTYDGPPYFQQSGSIPFIDIGGKYLISGSSYSPQVLQGKTHQQIADALHDPDSPIAQAADGTANLITAAICASTNNAPSDVCMSKGVQAAAQQLP